MLIFEDKSILGSVGGGLAESKVMKKDVKSSEAEKLFYFILSWMQM